MHGHGIMATEKAQSMILVLAFTFFFLPFGASADSGGKNEVAMHIPSEDTALKEVKVQLKDKTEHTECKANRLGNQTFEIVCFRALSGSFVSFQKVAPDFQNWRGWAFKGINVAPPSENEYVFQIHDTTLS